MRLILVRHAKAASGEPDEARPLTSEGHEAALALGEQLGSLRPDAVLSSPLLRARQTAGPIAAVAGVELEIDGRLAPGATLEELRATVAGHGETVVVVGHEPDCGLIVEALTGAPHGFRPGDYAEVEL